MGPWDLPTPSKAAGKPMPSDKSPALALQPPPSTDIIVAKNLFDPERGASVSRDAEENSRAFQRIRNLILMGTITMGSTQVAIVQDGSPAGFGQASQGGAAAPMRLKVGDSVEGFRLSEIAPRRVVFSRDTARIEVALDYFRKVETAQPRPGMPGGQPGVSAAGVPGQPPGLGQATAPAQAGTPGGVVPPRVIPNLPRRARIPVPPNQGPDS
jgi:hypothetical protein